MSDVEVNLSLMRCQEPYLLRTYLCAVAGQWRVDKLLFRGGIAMAVRTFLKVSDASLGLLVQLVGVKL